MIALAVLLSSLAGVSPFDIEEIYIEMSMDTYPNGMDASPLVKTMGNAHPKIDSLSGDTLYGKINTRILKWNKKGECVSPLCKPTEDLTWSDIWVVTP